MADFPPEIERELTVPLMIIPEFSGHIKEDDLADFGARDKKMLIAVSIIEQKVDFFILWQQRINTHLRQMQAERIIARQEEKEIHWRFGAVKWLVITVGAGIIVSLVTYLFKKWNL